MMTKMSYKEEEEDAEEADGDTNICRIQPNLSVLYLWGMANMFSHGLDTNIQIICTLLLLRIRGD